VNAKEFHDKHGLEAVQKVCQKLGVSHNYWKGVKGLHRTVGVKRAVEFAVASDEVTGDPMTVVDLLRLSELPPHIVGQPRGNK
jgi:hypothetical protein